MPKLYMPNEVGDLVECSTGWVYRVDDIDPIIEYVQELAKRTPHKWLKKEIEELLK